MDKTILKSKYKSEYQLLLIETYGESIPEKNDTESTEKYHSYQEFMFMLTAPKSHGVENKMLEYIREHDNWTINELDDYFEEIVPPGYSPYANDKDEI